MLTSRRKCTFVIATSGTEGDLRPPVALGRTLAARGHRVILGGPPELESIARRAGLELVVTAVSMRPLIATEGAIVGDLPWWRRRQKALAMRAVIEFLTGDLALHLRELPRLAQQADALLGSTLIYGGSSIAEAAGIPFFRFGFSPQNVASPEHPPPGRAGRWESHSGNARAWHDFMRRFGGVVLPQVNAFRLLHNLAPFDDLLNACSEERHLIGTDALLEPLPSILLGRAPRAPIQTGYWYIPAATEISAGLQASISALPKRPLYVGFGSMPSFTPVSMARDVVRAAQTIDRPVVLRQVAGSLSLDREGLPSKSRAWAERNVLEIGEVELDRLFPLCHAAVHHGGTGTIATAARAGIPQIAFPLAKGSDQMYCSARLAASGIGIGPIERGAVTFARLRRAFHRLERDYARLSLRAREVASELARLDREEPPLEAAASLLERTVLSPSAEPKSLANNER